MKAYAKWKQTDDALGDAARVLAAKSEAVALTGGDIDGHRIRDEMAAYRAALAVERDAMAAYVAETKQARSAA